MPHLQRVTLLRYRSSLANLAKINAWSSWSSRRHLQKDNFSIATDCWMQYASDSNHEKKMHARGSLICHNDSYPFKERNLTFEKPIKIGRSVARARAATNNAIFDCKVLSRNHALLWYESGKFFLKDTKSSNGTFINNKRLSPSGEESTTREVCSGDIVQFGVDVIENNPKAKVTHGCIVATLKLYLPNGKEAKENILNSDCINVTFEDLYKLNQFIQEAGRRESALKTKLEYMQLLLEQTRVAAIHSWKALVLEDCLLSRLEILESQVIAYSKNFGEDKLRIELVNLLEDKALYQNATKELLQKKVQEINKNIGKVQNLKCRLSETEEETQILHNIIKDNQNELQELTVKYMKVQQILQDTTDKLHKTKIELKEAIQQSEKDKHEFMKVLEDQKNIERNLKISLKDLTSKKVNIQKQITALRNYMQIVQNIKNEKGTTLNNDYLNPTNIIDNILSKWNYIFLDVVNYEILINKFEQESNLNSVENNLKLNNSFCIDNSFSKNCYCIDSISTEFNPYKYILPPVSGKTLVKSNSIVMLKDLMDESKNKFIYKDNENFIGSDTELEIQKVNENISVSEIDGNITDNKNKNITSVKLILKFSYINDNIFVQEVLNSNNFEPENFCSNPKNLLDNSLSRQILKVAQQIHNIIEINKNLLPEQKKSKLQQVYFHDTFPINDYKSLITCKFILNDFSEDFILHNIIHFSNSLEINDDNINYHTINQELQDLNLLSYEPNGIIFNKLKNYYQVKNESQIQELSEQLVILKEKYNIISDEKANIIKKYKNLEAQCKDFINTTYMVPIYYVVPIMFILICMLLDKIL